MKYFEIVFADTYYDDNGAIQNDVVKEVVTEEKLDWYKKNVHLFSVKEVDEKQPRKVISNL